MEHWGIDVSEHNGTLDWEKLKAAGISFAILRSGYGVTHEDNQFIANIRGAIAQGIPVGIYHFSYALTEDGARQEAAFVLKLLEPYRESITLPVFFDFEYDTVDYAARQGVALGKAAFNNHAVAFCEAIRQGGYTPGIYYNLDYLRRYVDSSKLGGYVQWFAQYAEKPGTGDYDLWQYSSTLTIPGHQSTFDANLLKNTALLKTKTYTPGWHRDDTGWWYADTTTSYYQGRWAKLRGKWYYFKEDGYMLENTWKIESNGDTYYLGADGAMVTGKVVGIGTDGRLQPIEGFYHLISELPDYYRAEIDPLVASGKLKGRSGEGENLVLDMSESAIRAIIIASR